MTRPKTANVFKGPCLFFLRWKLQAKIYNHRETCLQKRGNIPPPPFSRGHAWKNYFFDIIGWVGFSTIIHPRNDPGLWLVYSDRARRDKHAHIGETSQRVANLERGHSEVGNFDQKMTLFSDIMSISSPLGGDRATFKRKLRPQANAW